MRKYANRIDIKIPVTCRKEQSILLQSALSPAFVSYVLSRRSRVR